jgi:hypothetical protein
MLSLRGSHSEPRRRPGLQVGNIGVAVMPAQAGIQDEWIELDSRRRRE